MSFILDALKKVEEDKRRAEARQTADVAAMGQAGGASRRGIFVMIGIAMASAALTASLLVLGRGGESTSAVELPDAAPGDVPHGTDTSVANDVHAVQPKEVVEVDASAPEPGSEPSARTPVARPRRAQAPPPKPVAQEAAAPPVERSTPEPELEPVEETVEPQEQESAAAFRLVGRESPRLYGEPVVSASEDGGTESESVADEASAPDHFPKFVLQGTSVIDGEPVAVINDQRVFEGDRVEGARVLGIEERAVELELEGVRFRIQL